MGGSTRRSVERHLAARKRATERRKQPGKTEGRGARKERQSARWPVSRKRGGLAPIKLDAQVFQKMNSFVPLKGDILAKSKAAVKKIGQ